MHSVRRRSCQTFCVCLLVSGCLPGLPAAPARAPVPPPPPWQAEINAARGLQAALEFLPAQDEDETRTRRARLAATYRQLAAKYPDAALVQQAVGDGLAGLTDQEAGLPYWQRAATLDPQNAQTADSLGSAYLRMGRVREAAAEFQRAVDARPDAANYHFDLANIQYLFRRQLLNGRSLPDEQAVLRVALEHFRRAAELAPTDLRLAKAYAETFYVFAQPDWPQALAAWKAVLALSGDHGDFARGHLARISLRLGRTENADAYLAQIHDPAYDGLKKSLRTKDARTSQDKPIFLLGPVPVK